MKKLKYKMLGNTGKKVIMIPGWGFTHEIWLELAQSISKYHTVLLCDLPGMGMNKNIGCDNINELLEIFQNSFPSNCSWLGWSFGGMLGLLFADKYKNNVDSIIMINTTLKWVATNTWPGMLPIHWHNFKHLYSTQPYKCLSWFARQQNPSEKREHIENIKTHLYASHDANGEILSSYLNMVGDIDLREVKCKLKITCIYGRVDKILPSLIDQKSLDKISKNNKVIILNDAGHAPFLSHQDTICSIVQRAI